MPRLAHLLASSATPGPPDETLRLIVLITMMIVAFVIMGVVLLFIRKNLFVKDIDVSGESLSLHDIRELHRTGRITDEECERMKALVLPTNREVHPDVAALRPATDPPPNDAPDPDAEPEGTSP